MCLPNRKPPPAKFQVQRFKALNRERKNVARNFSSGLEGGQANNGFLRTMSAVRNGLKIFG